MSHPYIFKGVPDSVLVDSLTSWPKGTVGAAKEKEVIKILNRLCKSEGYGRIPQLSEQIENIWRDPENAKKYKKQNEDRNNMMTKIKEKLKEK